MLSTITQKEEALSTAAYYQYFEPLVTASLKNGGKLKYVTEPKVSPSPARKSLDSHVLAKKTHAQEVDKLVTLKEALALLTKAQEEQERALAAAKIEEKNIEEKAETKKDKDITVVVDSNDSKERLKDKFKEGILSITRDMDGFEKFHLQQYKQQLANYARFLAEYLDRNGARLDKVGQLYTYSNQNEDEKPRTMEVQMLLYSETQDFVRTTVMNDLLGKSGTNYVNPNTKETWDIWRLFQHNFVWSTYYTSQWRN